MKAAYLGCLLGFLAAAAQAGSPPAADPAVDIARFETAFAAALAHNDVRALQPLLADDWRIISGDGHIITRASFRGVLTSGDLRHTAMSSSEQTIRTYGSTALVTARATGAGSYKGTEFRTDEIATDVLVKLDGRWVCALTQLTTVSQH